jgi:hypothetical protein
MLPPKKCIGCCASCQSPHHSQSASAWILQDLLDLPRTYDVNLTYSSAAAGGRLVQDYRRCTVNCLDAVTGLPRDMVDPATGNATRDFAAQPYGKFGDYYVRR